ncbi:DUF4301 family protein [Puteibacter caeruleilacunae]|nr:DUF4301 family protein [Puteibacter caeruleilacunae]
MFTEKDIQQIDSRGSNQETIKNQLNQFATGFPFLTIKQAATIGKGIVKLNDQDIVSCIEAFDQKIQEGLKPLKFVPASGAASRMFKDLFAYSNSAEKQAELPGAVQKFVDHLDQFAFCDDLLEKIENKVDVQNMLDALLTDQGLNYGNLPKGLLKFHKYEDNSRTPFEEHLVEGASYSKDQNKLVRLHMTVSPQHKTLFQQLFNQVKALYENKYDVTFEISFSEQKPSTDTIAAKPDNTPFRETDGSLLFRPGGHGALIENLNDLKADLVFIKNIDNVVPDYRKDTTIKYKKALAGYLLKIQEKLYKYQKFLKDTHYYGTTSKELAEIAKFLEEELNVRPAENLYYAEKEELYQYLKLKLNRPLRICGMVKNEGEPGGGPFWAENPDKTVSLQIAESSQVDHDNETQYSLLRNATHFNPVDLVCSYVNYKGEKYNLLDYVDPQTGFISNKSKNGKELKALELPGLWNGAMSNWNTIFIEVPAETFSPVKSVNDLLREEHQPK